MGSLDLDLDFGGRFSLLFICVNLLLDWPIYNGSGLQVC